MLTGFGWVLFGASIVVAVLPALRWLFTDGSGGAGRATTADPADTSSLRFPV